MGFMLSSPPDAPKAINLTEVPRPADSRARSLEGVSATNTVFGELADVAVAQSQVGGGLGQLEMGVDGDESRYWWGSGIVTHTDGKRYLAPPVSTLTLTSGAAVAAGFASVVKAGVRYDFTWQDTRIYRRDASNGTNAWSLVYTAPNPVTDLYQFASESFEPNQPRMNIAIPALADPNDYKHAAPDLAATWVPGNVATTAFSTVLGKPSYFSSVRGYIFAAVDNNKLFYNVDPVVDSWVGPINTSLSGNYSGPPGDQAYAIKGLVAVNDFLFVIKNDAIYNVDSQQEVTEAVWQWKSRPSAQNFKYFCTGGSWLFYSVSPEVYAYDPTTGRNVPIGLSTQSGFSTEDILGVAADNQYLYVLAKVRVPNLRSASSAALFRCVQTGASAWSFECIWEDTASTAYTRLAAFPAGETAATRVYWGNDAGTSILHMDIPANWDESTSGSYATSGTFYTSLWRTGFETFIKRWLWVGTDTLGLDADDTIRIAYSTDGGTTFTNLAAAMTSPGLTFTDFANISASSMVLRFTWASGGTNTGVLRTHSLHARPRWRFLQRVEAPVRIADYIELLNGTKDPRKMATIVSDLETLRTSNALITYEDFLGHSFAVSFDQLDFHPIRHETPDRQAAGYVEQEAMITLTRSDSGA